MDKITTKEELYEYVFAKKLYDQLPMPKSFYSQYNVPIPQPMDFQQFLKVSASRTASTELGEIIKPKVEGNLPFPELPNNDLIFSSSLETKEPLIVE
jgi:hypothetical protein